MARAMGVFTGLLALGATALLTPAHAAGEDTAETENEAAPVLALTVRCDEAALQVGGEIPIVFVIENEGNSDYTYADRNYDRSGRMPEYKLSAVDVQGEVVADPRAKRPGGIGGGLYGEVTLAPGTSYTKTIALNRWALLTEPGTYRVTGTYYPEGRGPAVVSPPIRIEIQPRTEDEIAVYIEELSTQLAETSDGQDRAALVRKLMYTCDRRAIPALLEAMYTSDAANYWAGEAFNYYLADDQEVDDALLHAAMNRGLARGMFWTLKERGFTREQIMPVIDVSLSADHADAWSGGAQAAQQYADDRFTPRLIAIAKTPDSNARTGAIYALAFHRTDASVAALKELLQEPDPPRRMGRTIREITEDAIRSAYTSRGNTEGRRLRKDDFDETYQKPRDAR